MTTAIVVAGGPAPDLSVGVHLPVSDLVIAADSGLDHAITLGLKPSLVVGDLDSISQQGRDWIDHHGPVVDLHPTDKNETDLDLAISVAAQQADRIVVVDSGLGRIDHSLANLLLLASERFADVAIQAYVGAGLVSPVRGTRELLGAAGDLVSLLAIGGAATGVSTVGLRWSFVNAVLVPSSTWGVSNEFATAQAQVTVDRGVVLAMQPKRPPVAG